MLLTITFILLVVILAYIYVLTRRPKLFPPGPLALPLIGTLYLSGQQSPYLLDSQLSKKYGPILGLKFAVKWVVVLHDAKLIRDAYNNSKISGRFSTQASAFLIGDEYGILQAQGEIWTEQRRFGIRTLREFGFGKATMEEMILEEANELCDWLKKSNGQPIQLGRRFSLAVVNSLWRILTGERYEHDDPILTDILEKLDGAQKVLLNVGTPLKTAAMFLFPKMSKIFYNWSGWKKLEESALCRTELFHKLIEEHSDTLDTRSPRDFVDLHLMQTLKTDDVSSSFHSSVGKRSLQSVISDLYFAGSDTTSVTLKWAFLYFLHYPEVQKKIQAEIDMVVGSARNPSLSDRKHMVYTEATIMEILRYSSIVPLGVGHMVTEDITFHGYNLPKGTLVNPNLYHVHHDPEVWGDPENFRPERFLSPDGSSIQRHEALMPFSVGRRACMGESLAKDSLFLFLTTILQKLEVKLPNGCTLPPLDGVGGQVTLQPKAFEVSINIRR